MYSSQKDSRHVNHLLHTLRGEQFRHAQNVRRSRTHISSTININRNVPTLPIELLHVNYDSDSMLNPAKTGESNSASKCSGPGPPKSWTLTSKKDVPVHETVAWREQALSVIFSRIEPSSIKSTSDSKVPPLALLCLQHFVSTCTTAEFREDVVPFIPPHLRRELVRYMAVHSPLQNSKLYPLFEAEGHTDGELIIVGPSANLRDDYFLRTSSSSDAQEVRDKGVSWDWDSDECTSSTTLQSFILVSTRLAVSTLLTLPPTITYLALINLSSPIPLHRIPSICPLLVVLDLSYNNWLASPSNDVLKSLDRVDWLRWSHLRVVGFRECHIPDGILKKLNNGRWDDVEVLQ